MDVSVKSIATLIDELFTVLIRCWYAQEQVQKKGADDHYVAYWAKVAQDTNARRAALKKAIDERVGEGFISDFIKTYDHKEIGRRFNEVKSEFNGGIEELSAMNVSELAFNEYYLEFTDGKFYPMYEENRITDCGFDTNREAWQQAWWHYRLNHVQA